MVGAGGSGGGGGAGDFGDIRCLTQRSTPLKMYSTYLENTVVTSIVYTPQHASESAGALVFTDHFWGLIVSVIVFVCNDDARVG